jgi:hypothetical protein
MVGLIGVAALLADGCSSSGGTLTNSTQASSAPPLAATQTPDVQTYKDHIGLLLQGLQTALFSVDGCTTSDSPQTRICFAQSSRQVEAAAQKILTDRTPVPAEYQARNQALRAALSNLVPAEERFAHDVDTGNGNDVVPAQQLVSDALAQLNQIIGSF